MSKIQLYDILENKVVDIPEKEIENVKNMGRIFTEIGRIWEAAKAEKISGNVFVSGVLKFLEFAVRRDPFECIPGDLERTADSKIFQKTWKEVHSKVEEAIYNVFEKASDELCIKKFKKPYNQLTYADKGIVGDENDILLYVVACCSISETFKNLTPYFWRVDGIKDKINEKAKAKAEKRVPVGN